MTANPSRHQAASQRRSASLVGQLSDLVLLAGLCVLALLVLRTTYGGTGYLISGGAGIATGLVLSYGAVALGVPALAVAVATVGAYFLVGLAVPGPRSFAGLASLAGNGWKQLLTTLPPIGESGPLLGIPFLLGLVAATLGGSLALRCKPSLAPLAAPAALLAATILLGMPTAPTLLLGAAFVAVALGWASLRHHRTRPTVQHGSRQTTRIALGLGMLALAAFGASAIGPGLPLAKANTRLVLRNYVHPPFDLQQYPSPLAGFRKYTKNGRLYDETLFIESGLPDGAPLRIATMTSYDGKVWGTGDPTLSTASTATFQRVGTSITTGGTGTRAAVAVHVADGYTDTWVPTAGQLSKIRFSAKGDGGAFRYNLATDTGVVPEGLHSGDTVTMGTLVPPANPDPTHATPFGAPEISPDVLAFVADSVGKWTNGVTGTWPQVLAIARHLRETGKYSDGAGDEAQYLPGHSIGRLTAFLSGPQLVGDDEQYAAIFALMANYLGVPTRVVLGALPEPGGVIKGKDVHAWVEVHVANGDWLAIPTSEFMPDTSKKPDKIPPQEQQNTSAAVVPPPNAVRPPSSVDSPDQQQTHVDHRTSKNQPAAHGGFHIPRAVILAGTYGGLPILAVVFGCLAIVGLKGLRRRRRRKRGPPSTRVSAGWREIVDYARDTGRPVPAGQTRTEDARSLTQLGLAPLATSADAVVFGPGQPSPDTAAWYWSEIEHTRRQIGRELTRWQRLRAAISLRSLRAPARQVRVSN
ncbi:MAG TPA: transglutaminase-like domain-containing protein [Jatrophihabitantaceae bacterium]